MQLSTLLLLVRDEVNQPQRSRDQVVFNIEEKNARLFFIIACIKALTLKMGAVQYWLEHAGLFFGGRGTASL
jgi:hypothetical protein